MKFCKVTSVLYYIFAGCYAIGAGGVLLGWFFTGAASAVFGDIGMVPISAAMIVVLTMIFGFVFIYVHSAMLLDSPKRQDVLVYYLYQAASICFAIFHLCGGVVLNSIGFLNVVLSIVYYGVMLTVPILGAVAMKKKREEQGEPQEENVVEKQGKKNAKEETKTTKEMASTKVEKKQTLQHGIYVLHGEYEGNFFSMNPEEEVILGTNPNVCNILFTDPKISRRHCKIQYSEVDQLYYIIDYSTNGTFFMDGTRLPMGRVQSCKLGTKICFENQNHIFQLL
ncbi:MAG: FHA domain-containing protein [Eubacterium sp.]|nr:FHA domain-containing protein [Eubacterium sp.]